jgi:hypothetical protein
MTKSVPLYVQMLLEAFSRRQLRNPLYSLRAFARDLEISVSHLSEVLSQKRGLSQSRAKSLATRLEFSQAQTRLFVAQVTALFAPQKTAKEKAKRSLAQLHRETQFRELNVTQAQLSPSLKHLVVLTWLQDNGDPRDIQNRLGLTNHEFQKIERDLVIGNLLSEGMLFYSRTETDVAHVNRAFHKQYLHYAPHALEEIPLEKRDFSCAIMSFSDTDYAEAVEDIRVFRRRFLKKYGSRKPLNKVMALGIQFLPVDERMK